MTFRLKELREARHLSQVRLAMRRDLSRWFSAKAHQKMQWGCRTLLVRQPCCNSAQICKCIAQMGIKAERLIHSLIAGSAGDGQAGKGVFFAPFLRCLCQ